MVNTQWNVLLLSNEGVSFSHIAAGDDARGIGSQLGVDPGEIALARPGLISSRGRSKRSAGWVIIGHRRTGGEHGVSLVPFDTFHQRTVWEFVVGHPETLFHALCLARRRRRVDRFDQ